ncbi:metallophosphoesterase [Alkalicoccus luteus]|uniref:Metallophosphoesterase n=1 Tax=Alkalicoccus luteus TaxID=1237094 RepID=A0A969PSN4_9BACI|nr:metallophosphoesterase [Alkalicoccus luteus]NJP38790.1 metallophosphoesterase [Alkalicoccus luteus]
MKKAALIAAVGIMIGIGLYWHSNAHIQVVKETLYIDGLPEAFEGFTLLQITDLHEQTFGSRQDKLTEVINELDYDMPIFTGDLLDDEYSTNTQPVYDLIEGMHNLNDALFVGGNTDPDAFLPVYERDGMKNILVEGLSERGVTLLDSVYRIERRGESIIVADFDMLLRYGTSNRTNPQSEHVAALDQEMINADLEESVVLSIYHYPLPDIRLDIYKEDPAINLPDIDLHIAGHYHGGEIRIPFYGALLVPEAYYSRFGLFPPQDRVKGLWEYAGIQQYVSTGLGSSGFLNTRLFNPPEVNLIELKRG